MAHDLNVDPPRLLELLPEFYRENPAELRGLRIAEELIASLDAGLRRAASRLNDERLLELRESWFPPPRSACDPDVPRRRSSGAGTRRGLLRWFEMHTGRVPTVWAGVEVHSVGADRVQVRRPRQPAAVLVWEAGGLSESAPPPAVPPEMIPLRTRLQLILSMSENEGRVTCHGHVLRARILFDSHSRDTEA